LKYGFGDEAGDVGWAARSTRYLVVAVILTDEPERLRRVVARIRRGMGKKLKQIPELKAYHTPRSGVTRLLRKVAKQDVEIIAAVWRKDEKARPGDPEDGYRHLCALAAKRCVGRYPQLSLVLDKRYTNARLRDLLVKTIIGGIGDSAVLVLQQSESRREKALQVADAVAWGIFQRYERGDMTFYDIIQGKIIVEEVVGKQKNWLTLGADSHRSKAE